MIEQIKTLSSKISNIALYSLISLLMFASFSQNTFNVANQNWFNNFQIDSEHLVLGRMLSDKLNMPQHNSGLYGFYYKGAYSQGSRFRMTEELVKNPSTIPDITVDIKNYTDQNWYKGVNRSQKLILVDGKVKEKIDPFIGRKLSYNGEIRNISKVDRRGNNVHISYEGEPLALTQSDSITITLIGSPPNEKNFISYAYDSQYGLQGMVFSYLYNVRDLNLNILRNISCSLLVIVLLTLGWLMNLCISPYFGTVFLFGCTLSPWVTAFAKNLYWVEFTWFLPAVFSYLYFYKRRNFNIQNKIFVLTLVFISVLIKALCGYEYLSSIILFALSPFIFEALVTHTKESLVSNFKECCLIGCVCILAFMTALIIHSTIRGETVIEGLRNIFFEDVLKRTYGDSSRYSGRLADSLNASPLYVVKLYLTHWRTEVFKFFSDKGFIVLLASATLVLLNYLKLKEYKNLLFGLALLFTFCICPLSWFVLAKGHSYIHLHMNFVLWYFGFAQALVFVIGHFALQRLCLFIQNAKSCN